MDRKKKLKLNKFCFRLSKLITKDIYIKFSLCFFLIVISGITEALMIGMVLPFVSSMAGSQNILNKKLPIFSNIFDSYNDVAIYFIVIVIFATSIRIFNIKYISYISSLIGNCLAKKAYKNLLFLNHVELYKLSSSYVINIFISNLNDTVETIYLLLITINSLIVFGFIISTLILINLKVTLSIALVLFVIYYLLISIQSDSLRKSSLEVNNSQIKASKALQETKGLINQIKLMSKENYFYKRYSALDLKVRRARAKFLFLTSFPKYTIEGILLIVIITLLIVSTKSNPDNFVNFLPVFGMYVFATQRLIPLGQIIYSTRSVFLYYSEPINNILNLAERETKVAQLSEEINNKKIKFSFSNLIVCENIFFKYESNKKLIENFNLTIKRGEILGISTPTGSGKSTLLNIIMGLLNPNEGRILIDGRDLYSDDDINILRSWWKTLAYVPQEIYLSNDNIKNNIAFDSQDGEINNKKLISSSKIAQIHNYIIQLPNKYDELLLENGSNLSGGQKQRIGIARALYTNPKVLILDEATNALDEEVEKIIFDSLKKIKNKITIIVVSHEKSTLSHCDKVIKNI